MIYRFDDSGAAAYVPPETLYLPEEAGWTGGEEKRGAYGGCGFLTEENRPLAERLSIPELNSGFEAVYWARGRQLTRLVSDGGGVYADWDGEGELPLTFVADVPSEGNYLVRVTLAARRPGRVLLFLGRRRLAWLGSFREPGQRWTGEFVTNICPVIPRTYESPMEDLTLDVTLVGSGASLVSVEAEAWDGRTLYLAGDSTVTDQSAEYPYLPGRSYCGWGQMLPACLGTQYAVSNHSHSGLTTESFRGEGHYAILYERLRPGDLCLLQFGHNDQKLRQLAADGGYRENLIRYITEIKEKGAQPVLVTPLARNSWRGDDGSYNDLLAPYAAECIRLAGEYQLPLIDLHQRSMDFVKACGRERARRWFFPDDYTHGNDYGAYLFAGYVFEGLAGAGLVEGGGLPAWEPPEELPALTVPEEYAGAENPADGRLFEDLERPLDPLTRVEALELVSGALHFFPTNVYNDLFDDVIGHERYAGAVECAWQNGLIPEDMVENRRFYPQKNVTAAEFCRILKNGYQGRRTWTKACGRILSERAEDMGEIARGDAADLCRRLLEEDQ